MDTYKIRINGIVQGVGFRPFVYNFFSAESLLGSVNNTNEGVVIYLNCNATDVDKLIEQLIKKKPQNAIITSCVYEKVDCLSFNSFQINDNSNTQNSNLFLTPDYGICNNCIKEIDALENRRFQYPFTTCVNCGPRLSIINDLPYDRKTTSMISYKMCVNCENEYKNPKNRRFHSQTNSCPACRIELSLFENNEWVNNFLDLDYIVQKWTEGKIIAIKGTGGFVLTCDANNPKAIERLRKLKRRPSKPFALMYHDVYELAEDVEMGIGEKLEIEELYAPIILFTLKKEMDRWTKLSTNEIAPGLNSIGVVLPNSALFKILLDKFKKPIIYTSANVSGAPILFDEKKSLKSLVELSDIVLSNNREIKIPQDDSVVKLSSIKSYKTIIRRSRGLAPSFIQENLRLPNKPILALGAMLKSTFTILNNQKIHVSQYIGNTDSFDTQELFKQNLKQYKQILKFDTKIILIDKHQNYFTSELGNDLANSLGVELYKVQHHKAHLFAVLAENDLLRTKEDVLGVIWDGTGLGDDGNIWGGEFFNYNNGKTTRVNHINEFPFILGDKLPKEPRISALVLCANLDIKGRIENKFSKTEWNIFQKLITTSTLKSTSVGRLFDAVASIVLNIDKQTYEGEAALKLENAAYRYFRANNFTKYYSYIIGEKIPKDINQLIIEGVMMDLEKEYQPDFIAAKFHITLAHYINNIALKHQKETGCNKIAFSGGVFQNQWLKELILSFMSSKFVLLFHKQLSPNDENISFGQLMYYLHNKD